MVTQVVTEVWQPGKVTLNKLDADYIYLAATNYWDPLVTELNDDSNSTFDPGEEVAMNTLFVAKQVNPAQLMSKQMLKWTQ